jgi:hypothetical protein
MAKFKQLSDILHHDSSSTLRRCLANALAAVAVAEAEAVAVVSAVAGREVLHHTLLPSRGSG